MDVFIQTINKNIQSNNSIYWAITLNGTDKLIGTICLFDFSDDNLKAEIGYELLPDFQGKGIMQEAITEVIDFGFEQMNLKTITAVPSGDNLQSRKLLEKNNFKIDPVLQATFVQHEDLANMVIYSLTKMRLEPH